MTCSPSISVKSPRHVGCHSHAVHLTSCGLCRIRLLTDEGRSSHRPNLFTPSNSINLKLHTKEASGHWEGMPPGSFSEVISLRHPNDDEVHRPRVLMSFPSQSLGVTIHREMRGTSLAQLVEQQSGKLKICDSNPSGRSNFFYEI